MQAQFSLVWLRFGVMDKVNLRSELVLGLVHFCHTCGPHIRRPAHNPVRCSTKLHRVWLSNYHIGPYRTPSA